MAEQINLTTKVPINDIAAEVENDQWEIVMKLAQAHDVSAQIAHAILLKDLQL